MMPLLVRSTIVFACAFITSVSGAGTLYKSIGPDGKVVYGDKPPSEGRLDKTIKYENLPSSQLPAATLAKIELLKKNKEPAPPSIDGTVMLYTARWCGYCKAAKAYLAENKIPYREVDIDTEGGRTAFALVGGGGGIPLLFANRQRAQGYRPDAYDSIFAIRR
jgi:glutaredoxin